MKQGCMTYSSIFLGTQGIASCLHASSRGALGDVQAGDGLPVPAQEHSRVCGVLHTQLPSARSTPMGEWSRTMTCSSWPQT